MMAHRRLLTFAAGLALIAGAAHAQSGVDRRLDRVERDLKTLQSIVLQAQATGQPVVVRPEGADPAVSALSSRVDDLEMTLQRINGQVETLGHDLQEARRARQAGDAERAAHDKLIEDRLTRLEGQLATLNQAATAADPNAPPPDLAGGALPPEAGPPRRGQGDYDATTRAQANDTGILGGRTTAVPPPPPPPPPEPTPAETLASARKLLTTGQSAAAADAFQDFISRYPKDARTPEAYYWLGESYFAQRGYQNATAAFASALRSHPTTSWAPAAMVRLAQSLSQSGQDAQACAALSEFDQRYASKAGATLRSNAGAVRRRAHCG